jgi:amino acid adenylation domain-containing protein
VTTEDQTLWTLFHRHVAEHRDRACVTDNEGVRTYGDIEEQSAALAAALSQEGVTFGDYVLVSSDASADFLVAVLACFRLRAVYVPIDPSIPVDRLLDIADETAPSAIVTSQGMDAAAIAGAVRAPHLIVGKQKDSYAFVDAVGRPEDPAYVIYTSGSTGRPKGVMVNHASVLHLLVATNQQMDLHEDDVWSITHSFAFDVSVWELWSAIFNGGRAVLVPRATVRSATDLLRFLVSKGVTVLSHTPTALYQLMAAERSDPASARGAKVRYIVLAGEALDVTRVERWHDVRVMSPLLVNLYGITEGTVHVTYFDFTPGHRRAAGGRSLIGHAFGDGVLYLLDASLRQVGPGEIGELYLAGPGVANGYVSNPQLTASRFVACPGGSGTVMYRSGDLARQTPMGLEYLGRSDRQVKIRGYRIELGEIQSVLDEQPGVSDSVVVVRRSASGSAQLAAYLRPRPRATVPPAQQLRTALAKRLPEYMVPSSFTAVSEWPTNQNGKLDEAMLPQPARSDRTDTAAVPPRNSYEQNVVDVWSDVLGIEEIGVYDDFFHLGGDSMTAHRIARRLLAHGYIEARQVLQARSPAELATLLEAHPVEDEHHDVCEPKEPLLTPTQRRFWYEQLEHPGSAHLNVCVAFELPATPDPERLRHAIDSSVARSDVLRARFDTVDGDAKMRIAPLGPNSWEWRHSVETSAADRMALLEDIAARPFDLSAGPVLRAHLVEVNCAPTVLILVVHHAVVDGWSLSRLVDEIGTRYRGEPLSESLGSGRGAELLAQQLHGTDREHLRGWWAKELDGAPRPARLNRATDNPTAGADRIFRVDATVTSALRRLATGEGVTLYTVLVALTSIVLARSVDRDECTVGMVVSGRDDPRLAGVSEPTINTVPVRLPMSSDSTVIETIEAVRQRLDSAFERQALPFEEILTAARVPRIPGQLPLLDAIVVLQDRPPSLVLDAGGPAARTPIPRHSAVHSLTVEFTPGPSGELEARLEHRTAAVSPGDARRLQSQLQAVFADAVAHPLRQVADLDMLGVDGAAQLARFEKTQLPAGQSLGHSVLERILATFERWPEAVALSDAQGEMTYAELNIESAKLASSLVRAGLCLGAPVAVRVERGRSYIAALVAVWRAGGVPVLLDPGHPVSRARGIIDEVGADFVVQSADIDLGVRVSVTTGETGDISFSSDEMPVVLPKPADRAYVIYTSGSTGKPKGVAVQHFALESMVLAHLAHFDVTSEDRTAHFSGLGFDASVWDIVPALCVGARIDIPSRGELDSPSAYARWLAEHHTTVCFISTPVAELLIDEPLMQQNETMRLLLTGGSALTRRPLGGTSLRMINNYGPTETTIIATTGPVAIDGVEHERPHIGAPRAGATVRILDRRLRPVPPGVPGELYIAGSGLAEGYIARPALTSDRFVADPRGQGGRMYRSGDLASWTDDGFIRYHGRNDSQLQVRGVRVELAEIAHTLSSVCGGRQTHILASSTGHDAQLDAFVVGIDAVDGPKLRAELSETLPEQMLPRAIHRIDELPLTSNDKVDEARLRDLLKHSSGNAIVTGSPTSPSASEQTEQFRALWRDVLAVTDVADDANYFALGGDSIRTLKLVARARQAGFVMNSKDVFDHQTFGELAASVVGNAPVVIAPTRPDYTPASGWSPLLPAQHLLLTELHGSPITAISEFHQVVRVSVNTDAHTLSAAIRMLAIRHPALRTAVRSADGSWWQIVHDEPIGEVTRVVDSAGDDVEWVTGPMAVELGEMVRATICPNTNAHNCDLTIAIHHLGVDHVSWTVLLDELDLLLQGRDLLPRLGPDASEHAQHLRSFAQSEAGSQLAQQWARRDIGAAAVEAPFPSGRYGDARTASAVLDAVSTEELIRRIVPRLEVTMDEVLIAALGAALIDWTGAGSYRIALEGHGRDNESSFAAEQTVGWLTAYTPVSVHFGSSAFLDRLWNVRETLSDLPAPRASAAALRFSGRPGALATLVRPWISLNYLSELRSTPSGTYAGSPAMELHAAKHLPRLHAVDVVVSVQHGELAIAVTYNQAADAVRMARLAETMKATLMDFVADTKPAVDSGRRLPLTDLQSGLLMHSLADRERNLYNEQARISLPYRVDQTRMQQAWNAAIASTEALRISLQWRGVPEPVQHAHNTASLTVQVSDLRSLPPEERTRKADLLAAGDRRNGVVLTDAPLSRVRLILLDDVKTELVWTFHHIVLDGWSAMKVLGGVLDRYEATDASMPRPIPAAPPFSDYVRWLRRTDNSAAEMFWADYLARTRDRITASGMALPRVKGVGGSTAEVKTQFAFELRELELAARRLRVTKGVLAQAAWALCLAGPQTRAHAAFGVVVSGRSAPLHGIEDMIGLLINTVPMIVEVEAAMSVAEYVGGVQTCSVQLQEHEHLSLSRIQKLAGAASTPLFESTLVVENYPLEAMARHGVELLDIRFDTGTNYPLNLVVHTEGSHGQVDVLYDQRAYTTENIAALIRRFEELLVFLMRSPGASLSDAPPLQETISLAGSTPSTVLGASIDPVPSDDEVLTVIEERVKGCFKSVLDTPVPLTSESNFLKLGGDSLSALRLMGRLETEFAVEVNPVEIFDSPTVGEVSVNILRRMVAQLAEDGTEDQVRSA